MSPFPLLYVQVYYSTEWGTREEANRTIKQKTDLSQPRLPIAYGQAGRHYGQTILLPEIFRACANGAENRQGQTRQQLSAGTAGQTQ